MAQATSPSAATAQRRVNGLIANGLRAHDEATTAALKALQGRAAAAAAALGLHVDHLRDVRLDGPVPAPRPLGGMMAMAARAVPPQATVEVSAVVVLRP